MIGQILPQPPPRPVISDEELELMREIVKQSGYFERNKTRDVDHRLIREMIRWELPQLRLLTFLSGQTGGIPGASQPARGPGAPVCPDQEGGKICPQFDRPAAPAGERQRTGEWLGVISIAHQIFSIQLFTHNLPVVVQMQICTFFNPQLNWKQQFAPIIGKNRYQETDIHTYIQFYSLTFVSIYEISFCGESSSI